MALDARLVLPAGLIPPLLPFVQRASEHRTGYELVQ